MVARRLFGYHCLRFFFSLIHPTGDCMKSTWTLVAAGMLAAGSAHAVMDNIAAGAMMAKNGCGPCHSIDKKIVGPAYQDVAAKYKGDKDAVAKLTEKVKKGGVGVWGQIPMPPNSFVKDDDIKELVTWILTLKK